MRDAIEMATALAHEQGASAINRIVLRVGAYSGVDADALRFAFDAACADTLAADAVLLIEEVSARCRCRDCNLEFDPPGTLFTCPKCGSISADMIQGRELELATLEVS